MVTLQKFSGIVGIVIDNFEGGYYHPNMLSGFKPSDQAVLKDSGETMFGLDRRAGSQLARYTEWAIFWNVIDQDKAANPGRWWYQYLGGSTAPRLKELAGVIMYNWFNYLAKKYILIGSMEVIANDDRLIIHFSYAAWNGEGWLQRYSKALNEAIIKHEGDKETIFQEAIKARTMATNKFGLPNRAIRQQGKHMMDLFKKLQLI